MAKIKAKKSEVVVETKKDIKRKEKEIKRQNKRELSETEQEVRSFVILLIIVVIIVGIAYFLTNNAKGNTSSNEVTYNIQYDAITVGSILNRSEYDEYYVLGFVDSGSKAMDLYSLYRTYQNRDNVKKLYVVFLEDDINSAYYNKDAKANLNVTKVTDLMFNTDTLLHIKKGKIVKAYTKYADIEKILK